MVDIIVECKKNIAYLMRPIKSFTREVGHFIWCTFVLNSWRELFKL